MTGITGIYYLDLEQDAGDWKFTACAAFIDIVYIPDKLLAADSLLPVLPWLTVLVWDLSDS